MVKTIKKSAFGSAFSQQSQPRLTSKQSEVLYLLTKEFLTPKQISIRRKTKIRTVQAIIKKLKDLGVINNAFKEVRFIEPTDALSKKNNLIRLHGEEWNIIILYKDERYKQLLEKSNFLDVDGNTIRLSRDSVEVYSGKSFYADEVSKVTFKAFDYWTNFFVKLGNQLNIILLKSKVQNIKRVNAHYSEVGNELSKEANDKGEKIRIYTRDDGKLWFTIDNSFNLHEAECLHPKTSKDDMELVHGAFNDIRAGEWEKMKYSLDIFMNIQKDYAEQIRLHLEVMQQMKETLKKIEERL
jgi:DNA-binding CsgD family transcriptional regulator